MEMKHTLSKIMEGFDIRLIVEKTNTFMFSFGEILIAVSQHFHPTSVELSFPYYFFGVIFHLSARFMTAIINTMNYFSVE